MAKQRWTAVVEWPELGERELVDTDEDCYEADAEKQILAKLETDYLPGGKIVRIDPGHPYVAIMVLQ